MHDRLHRGVGFEVGCFDTDRFTLEQTFVAGDREDQLAGEPVHRYRQAFARQVQRAMIGSSLAQREAQEAGQRATIHALPSDPTLSGDVFEKTAEEHTKVDARGQTLAAAEHEVRLARRCQLLVEADLRQQLIEFVVAGVARPAAQLPATTPANAPCTSVSIPSRSPPCRVGFGLPPEGRKSTGS